ncbi:MAG TPA: glycosyltransferase family 2 protein [Gemmatimonadaceae bacterium]|nr:glycosyltransferase family 2 protein [Gemmatimonadaceae bacterium]
MIESPITPRPVDARHADDQLEPLGPLAGGTEPRDEPVLISVVIPVYNEEATLDTLFSTLRDRLAALAVSYEVVLIDDGSRDRTGEMIAEMTRRDRRFRSVQFSRNFGHQAAVTAGLHFARGSAVVVMDADLQDPPELLGSMIARWREGYHVVYAQRIKRHAEGVLKRGIAFAYYRLLQRLTDVDIPADTGDFCLMDRRVVDLLNRMPERNRYLRGMRAWLGFRQTAVPFERPPRVAGEPKYTFFKSLGLGINGIVGFSRVPLRIATYLGLTASAFSILLTVWAVYQRFVGSETVRGWASTLVVILLLGGAQLLMIGIVGEYLSRIYDEVKQRPMYVIGDLRGFEGDGARDYLTQSTSRAAATPSEPSFDR